MKNRQKTQAKHYFLVEYNNKQKLAKNPSIKLKDF